MINLTQFGAFVELMEGIDGLIHVSDLSWTKIVRHPKEVIEKGEKVWGISIDIYCINDDGNVLDACSLGVVAALKMARFPE